MTLTAAALVSILRGIVVLRVVSTSITATTTTVFESFPPRFPSLLLSCPLLTQRRLKTDRFFFP